MISRKRTAGMHTRRIASPPTQLPNSPTSCRVTARRSRRVCTPCRCSSLPRCRRATRCRPSHGTGTQHPWFRVGRWCALNPLANCTYDIPQIRSRARRQSQQKLLGMHLPGMHRAVAAGFTFLFKKKTPVGVVVAVKDERPQRVGRRVFGRRHALHDRLQRLLYADAHLGRHLWRAGV